MPQMKHQSGWWNLLIILVKKIRGERMKIYERIMKRLDQHRMTRDQGDLGSRYLRESLQDKKMGAQRSDCTICVE